MDCSLPDSSVLGILQARIVEWVAISFSGGLRDPGIELGSPVLQADPLPSEPPGKPKTRLLNCVQMCIFEGGREYTALPKVV